MLCTTLVVQSIAGTGLQATCDLSPTPLPCFDLDAGLSADRQRLVGLLDNADCPAGCPRRSQSGKEDTVTPLPHYLPVTAFAELMSSLRRSNIKVERQESHFTVYRFSAPLVFLM